VNLIDIKPQELLPYLPNVRPFIRTTAATAKYYAEQIAAKQRAIERLKGYEAHYEGVVDEAIINDYTDEQINTAKRMVVEAAIANQRPRKD